MSVGSHLAGSDEEDGAVSIRHIVTDTLGKSSDFFGRGNIQVYMSRTVLRWWYSRLEPVMGSMLTLMHVLKVEGCCRKLTWSCLQDKRWYHM